MFRNTTTKNRVWTEKSVGHVDIPRKTVLATEKALSETFSDKFSDVFLLILDGYSL